MDIKVYKGTHEIEVLDDKIEYIILLANTNPRGTGYNKVLQLIENMSFENIEVKFATSSFMGYGLYENFMLSLEDFKELLEKRGVKLGD